MFYSGHSGSVMHFSRFSFCHDHSCELIAGWCHDPEFGFAYESWVIQFFSKSFCLIAVKVVFLCEWGNDMYYILATSGISHNHIFKLIPVKFLWSGIWDCVPVLCVKYLHPVMLTINRQVVVLVRTRGLCIASRMPQVFLSNTLSNKSHCRL